MSDNYIQAFKGYDRAGSLLVQKKASRLEYMLSITNMTLLQLLDQQHPEQIHISFSEQIQNQEL